MRMSRVRPRRRLGASLRVLGGWGENFRKVEAIRPRALGPRRGVRHISLDRPIWSPLHSPSRNETVLIFAAPFDRRKTRGPAGAATPTGPIEREGLGRPFFATAARWRVRRLMVRTLLRRRKPEGLP